MPLEVLELESKVEETTAPELTEEGFELPIEDLLDEALSKPASERNDHERKLQELYKYTPFYLSLQDSIRGAALLGKLIEAGDAHICDTCGEVYRIGEWPLCSSKGGHGRVIPRNAQSDTVTSYFVNRLTGKIWIPGRNKHRSPIDRYGRPITGYERHDVRNFRERDQFYKLLDKEASNKYHSNLRREQQTFEPILKEGRKQARVDILASESRSPEQSYGREWHEKMMAKTEAANKAKENYSPNSHIEPWEFNQSNLQDANMDKLEQTLKEKQPDLSTKQKEAVKRAKPIARGAN